MNSSLIEDLSVTYDDEDNSTYYLFENHSCTMDVRTLDLSIFNYTYRKTTWKPIGYEEIIKIVLYIIVFFVSLIGNILVMLVVYFNLHMRTSTNQYLVNLAVADLLVTLCCTWVHLVRHLSLPNYVLPSGICKLEAFIIATTLTASVLTLTVISIGRFIAVLFPLHAHTSPNHAYRIIILIWVASALMAFPTLPHRQLYSIKWRDYTVWHCDEFWPTRGHYDSSLRQCIITYDGKRVFYFLFTLILYFIPVSIMIVSYSLVVWRLWASRLPGEAQQQNTNSCVARSKRKVVKMVTAVLLAFVFCWTPLQSIILYSSFTHSGQHKLAPWFESAEYVAYFIAHANSAINPIIYCSFNASFKQGLKALLQCRITGRGRLHSRRMDWKGLTVRTRETTYGLSAHGDQLHLQNLGPIQSISSQHDGASIASVNKEEDAEQLNQNNHVPEV